MQRYLFDAQMNVLVIAKDSKAFVANSQRFESHVPAVGGAKGV